MLLVIPDGVTEIRPYAFASRYLYEHLHIPASVTKIGEYAFNRCFDLMRTYVFAQEPPEIESSAIDDLDLSLRYLYVPTGTKSKYKLAKGWGKYGNRIVEFDAETMDVATMTAQARPAAADIYDLQGRLVRKAHEGTRGLTPGVYVVGGRKMIVR